MHAHRASGQLGSEGRMDAGYLGAEPKGMKLDMAMESRREAEPDRTADRLLRPGSDSDMRIGGTIGRDGANPKGRLRRRGSLPLAPAFGMAASFALFGVLAATRFPHPYGPWENNTISQLGNPNLNPNGYVLYLIGCALSGICAIGFFAGLGWWAERGARNQTLLIRVVQGLGVAGGFALVMNAVFPENHYAQHHFWAGLVFNSWAIAAIVAIPALRKRGGSNAGLIAFNLVAFAAVILMFVFSSVHWMEWPPAAMFLMFPLVLSALVRSGGDLSSLSRS
ncbi:MAG: hypothetical protein NVS2B16_34090 [Chloroflexota bacterium]